MALFFAAELYLGVSLLVPLLVSFGLWALVMALCSWGPAVQRLRALQVRAALPPAPAARLLPGKAGCTAAPALSPPPRLAQMCFRVLSPWRPAHRFPYTPPAPLPHRRRWRGRRGTQRRRQPRQQRRQQGPRLA